MSSIHDALVEVCTERKQLREEVRRLEALLEEKNVEPSIEEKLEVCIKNLDLCRRHRDKLFAEVGQLQKIVSELVAEVKERDMELAIYRGGYRA